MKTYKIGEISKMLGISSETIRNYEKKGLIRPCKDEYSNYRYFDIIQINHLLNIQRFHKYGYSLQEVGDIMQQTSMANLEMSLENKEAELINEAFYMNLKLNSIHSAISSMTQAQNAKRGCFLGKRPALYRMNYQKQFDLILDNQVQAELVKWLKHADLPFMSGSASPEVIKSGKHEFDFGFCLDKATAEFLGVNESEIVKYYEACPAIIFYYEATPESTMPEKSKMLLDFAAENHLQIKGESISRVIFASWEPENYYISHLVWVPYETRDEK